MAAYKKKRAANGNEKKKIHSDVQNSTIHRTNITQKPKELHEGEEKRQTISWRLFSLHHLHIEAKILLSDFEECVMR